MPTLAGVGALVNTGTEHIEVSIPRCGVNGLRVAWIDGEKPAAGQSGRFKCRPGQSAIDALEHTIVVSGVYDV